MRVPDTGGAARQGSVLVAVSELERRDARRPVKAASCLVIFLRIPKSAVILRVDGHAAVIAPPAKACLLHTSPCHRNGGTFHRPQAIACDTSHDLHPHAHIHAPATAPPRHLPRLS